MSNENPEGSYPPGGREWKMQVEVFPLTSISEQPNSKLGAASLSPVGGGRRGPASHQLSQDCVGVRGLVFHAQVLSHTWGRAQS